MRCGLPWRDLMLPGDDAVGVVGPVRAALFVGEVAGPVLVQCWSSRLWLAGLGAAGGLRPVES
jgi:hypothetical protein